VEKFGYAFSIGDKVMQTENNYERDVYNGDIGFVTAIDREEAELVVGFEGRNVRYPLASWTNSCCATQRASTSRRDPSTPWWSFRYRPSIT
jgi:ATP-dependent exoDNAse (exonuclease V) alpha subunit